MIVQFNTALDAGVMEQADMLDSKFSGGKIFVQVQSLSPALIDVIKST